jgi:hypothetical protein
MASQVMLSPTELELVHTASLDTRYAHSTPWFVIIANQHSKLCAKDFRLNFKSSDISTTLNWIVVVSVYFFSATIKDYYKWMCNSTLWTSNIASCLLFFLLLLNSLINMPVFEMVIAVDQLVGMFTICTYRQVLPDRYHLNSFSKNS